jgi:hypothetical protein
MWGRRLLAGNTIPVLSWNIATLGVLDLGP